MNTRWIYGLCMAIIGGTVAVSSLAHAGDDAAAACAASRARDADLSGYLPVSGPKPVPDIAFFDKRGQKTSISAYHGRGVVVNFWATWCPPCVKEMPALDAMKTELSDHGIDVVTVNEDKTLPGEVAMFFDRLGVKNLETFIDRKNALMKGARIASLPTTLIVNAQGQEVAAVLRDAEWDDPAIIEFIKNCINPEQTTE